MAALRWKHGRSLEEARTLMQAKLQERGYADRVKWNGDKFEADVGPWGSILSIQGAITEHEMIIERCGGAAGGKAMREILDILQSIFPNGENK